MTSVVHDEHSYGRCVGRFIGRCSIGAVGALAGALVGAVGALVGALVGAVGALVGALVGAVGALVGDDEGPRDAIITFIREDLANSQ